MKNKILQQVKELDVAAYVLALMLIYHVVALINNGVSLERVLAIVASAYCVVISITNGIVKNHIIRKIMVTVAIVILLTYTIAVLLL